MAWMEQFRDCADELSALGGSSSAQHDQEGDQASCRVDRGAADTADECEFADQPHVDVSGSQGRAPALPGAANRPEVSSTVAGAGQLTAK